MTIDEVIKEVKFNMSRIGLSADAANRVTQARDMAILTLAEYQLYEAIGTIAEFQTLKQKNEPKKPRFYAHNYYCTECGNLVGNYEFEWQRFQYCDKCGQAIDWQ